MLMNECIRNGHTYTKSFPFIFSLPSGSSFYSRMVCLEFSCKYYDSYIDSGKQMIVPFTMVEGHRVGNRLSEKMHPFFSTTLPCSFYPLVIIPQLLFYLIEFFFSNCWDRWCYFYFLRKLRFTGTK